MGEASERARRSEARWRLALYVAGATPRSLRAVENLRRICHRDLDDDVDLEVVDIYQQPERTAEADIVGAPTLVKLLPLPVRRLVGDLSDEPRVLHALGIAGAAHG